MESLVVYVEHQNATGQSGNVRPIAKIHSDGLINVITKVNENFPTRGLIFVSREFSKISDEFNEGELFILNNVKYDESSERDHYWAYGSDTERLPSKIFCPLVSISNAIDPSNPIVEENLSVLGSQLFFAYFEGNAYGPFVAMQNEEKWLLRAPDVTPNAKLPNMHIWKFSLKDAFEKGIIFKSDYQETLHELYLTDLGLLTDINTETIDFIDDKRLVNWANTNLFSKTEKSFTKRELSGLRESIEKCRAIKDLAKGSRAQRVLQLIETYGDFESERRQFLDGFFKSSKADELKEKYLESKKAELITEYKERLRAEAEKSIEEQIREKKRIETEVLQLKEQKNSLENELKESATQVEEKRRQFEAKVNEDIKQKKEELIKIDGQLVEKKETLKDLLDAESIHKAIEHLEFNKKQLQKQTEKLVQTKEELISQMVLELEVQQRAKNGGAGGKKQLNNVEIAATLEIAGEFQKEISISSVFDLYQAQWNAAGRVMPSNELIHLLIALHTNILTIFSGEPGSGKTSLANLIRYTLGLPLPCYKQISVGRGWVSSKDLLGYYNPINGEWVEAESGLNQFMQEYGSISKTKKPMGLIVLDEANLSPIEHYWSSFIGYCDEHSIDIDLSGSPVKFGLNEPFRFICTINNDHTTEKLSPRVIDRSAFFDLKSKSANEIPFEDEVFINSSQWIPFNSTISELNAQLAKHTDDDTVLFDEKFGDILNLFSDSSLGAIPIILSNRKIKKIQRHYYLSRLICKNESPRDNMDCISMMYLLPHISGYGTSFKKKLEAIKLKFQEKKCSRSEQKLTEIINRGDVIGGFYSFQ